MALFTSIALGVGAVATVVGGAITAKSQQKAAKRAQSANLENATNQRELERAIFLQSRGAEGFAKLPFYAVRDDSLLSADAKNSVETQMFQYALKNYDALTQLPPEERLAQLEGVASMFDKTRKVAGDAVGAVFDGTMTQEELTNMEGLKAARLGEAQVVRQSGKEALEEQLKSINAGQRSRGFSGDSLAQNQLEFDARRKIGTDAAMVEARAKIQNEQGDAAIRNSGVGRRLANVNAPNQLMESTIAAESAASRGLMREQEQAMSGFNRFMFEQPGTYNPTPLPTVQPIAGNGAIFGTALSGLGKAGTQAATLYGMSQLGGEGSKDLAGRARQQALQAQGEARYGRVL